MSILQAYCYRYMAAYPVSNCQWVKVIRALELVTPEGQEDTLHLSQFYMHKMTALFSTRVYLDQRKYEVNSANSTKSHDSGSLYLWLTFRLNWDLRRALTQAADLAGEEDVFSIKDDLGRRVYFEGVIVEHPVSFEAFQSRLRMPVLCSAKQA